MRAVAVSPSVAEDAESPALAARALRAQLESLREVITTLSPTLYRAAPSRVSGSIGGHVRHTLDHVRALVSHWGDAEMSYDSRSRGTPVETDPWAAIEEIDSLNLELEDLGAARLEDRVGLASIMSRDGGAVRLHTTFGREVAFVVQHTIHHAAIIAVLLEQVGVIVPAEFGYAPSTPAKV